MEIRMNNNFSNSISLFTLLDLLLLFHQFFDVIMVVNISLFFGILTNVYFEPQETSLQQEMEWLFLV